MDKVYLARIKMIREQIASGLSTEDYCTKVGIFHPTFLQWKKTLDYANPKMITVKLGKKRPQARPKVHVGKGNYVIMKKRDRLTVPITPELQKELDGGYVVEVEA